MSVNPTSGDDILREWTPHNSGTIDQMAWPDFSAFPDSICSGKQKSAIILQIASLHGGLIYLILIRVVGRARGPDIVIRPQASHHIHGQCEASGTCNDADLNSQN